MTGPDARGLPRQASARLTVDLAAIRQNYRFLARQAGPAQCATVLKANAYGLGMDAIAPALAGEVDTCFVAQPEEGRQLRALLPDRRIFVLHGFLSGAPESMVAHGLVPVLNSLEQVQVWYEFCRKAGTCHPAALQLDTGMSRFGLGEDDLADGRLRALEPVLVMSHLACADEPENPASEEQRRVFLRMSAAFPGVPRSLAASAGIFLGPDYHFDMVRPGIALYGLQPGGGETSLRPVLGLEAQVLQVRHVRQGARIGYGLTFRADRPMRVATVGIGYADGLFRALAGRGSLWLGPVRLPILGRLSMDSLTVDVSALPDDAVREGTWLAVLGPQQDPAALAEAAGTISYEVLTSLGQRFRRVYHEGQTGFPLDAPGKAR